MPVSISKVDGWKVSTPHGTKAKRTTLANALKQRRLLNAVEHGWKPTGKRTKRPSSSALRNAIAAKAAGK